MCWQVVNTCALELLVDEVFDRWSFLPKYRFTSKWQLHKNFERVNFILFVGERESKGEHDIARLFLAVSRRLFLLVVCFPDIPNKILVVGEALRKRLLQERSNITPEIEWGNTIDLDYPPLAGRTLPSTLLFDRDPSPLSKKIKNACVLQWSSCSLAELTI